MKSYEMVETLSEKTNVSLAQAKEALEKSNWDMLDAAIYIEEQKAKVNSPHPHGGYPGGGFGGSKYPNPPYGDPNMNGGNPNYTHFSGAPQPPFGNPPHGVPPYGAPNNGPFKVPPYDSRYNQPPVSVGEMFGRFCGRTENVVNKLFSNSFVISKNGVRVFQIPLLIFVIALLAGFFPVVSILIVGLIFDFKYSFEGRSAARGSVNEIFRKARSAADRMKDDFSASRESMREDFEASRETMKQEYETLKDEFQKGRDSTKQ